MPSAPNSALSAVASGGRILDARNYDDRGAPRILQDQVGPPRCDAGTLKSPKLLAGSCTVHALCSATMREVLVGDITAPITASGTLATGK